MVEPAYQELPKSDIPHVSEGGVHVAVIAGQSYGASVSLLQSKINCIFLGWTMKRVVFSSYQFSTCKFWKKSLKLI